LDANRRHASYTSSEKGGVHVVSIESTGAVGCAATPPAVVVDDTVIDIECDQPPTSDRWYGERLVVLFDATRGVRIGVWSVPGDVPDPTLLRYLDDLEDGREPGDGAFVDDNSGAVCLPPLGRARGDQRASSASEVTGVDEAA
jgi:hypothetical protein